MASQISPLRLLYFDLNKKLDDEDHKQLKTLVGDKIEKRQRQKLESPSDLFEALEEGGFIATNNLKLLKELFQAIQRPALADMVIGFEAQNCKWSMRILKSQVGQQGKEFKLLGDYVFHKEKLIVCNRGHNIAQVLDKDYSCEKEFGPFSGQFEKPFKPRSVAVSSDNLYFFLDEKNIQIVICDNNCKIVRIITLPRGVDPFCIVLVKRFVLVTDIRGHRVLKYTQDGEYITEVGGRGHGQKEFITPYFVAVNSKDVIMVTDYGNRCVKCFDSEFNYLNEYSHLGGQLYSVCSIAVDGNDNVYIGDDVNCKVVKLSSDGKWICNLFEGELASPFYLAVTAAGDRIISMGTPKTKLRVFTK
ncbi:tripartite motif-containing protein 2-like [Ptychodera flava]|uniref:tripartite motif-containing protein 2-like n=1 Tax=Ptychodera flava TaxID=63121 RepID=UPI003969F8D2